MPTGVNRQHIPVRGGGKYHMKGAGMFVFSFALINFCFAFVPLIKVLRAGAPFFLHAQISFSALHREKKKGDKKISDNFCIIIKIKL